MGRTTNKQRRDQQTTAARAKAAAARAQQQRLEQRRRAMTIIGSVLGVAAVIVVIAIVAITHKSGNDPAGNRAVASPAVVSAVGSVPDATLTSVGAGSVTGYPSTVHGQPPLTSGGKPEMLFIGAEFCPYCAAERWSMAVALSRFGTLNGYDTVSSSSTDVYPNTPSLDFYRYHYASKYLTFTAVENQDRDRKPLQPTTAAQDKLWVKIVGETSFPFVDFGNKYAIASPSYDPATLKGLTQAQIASQLSNPKSTVAKAVDGAANVITAAICSITKNQPATVCASVIPIQARFGA